MAVALGSPSSVRKPPRREFAPGVQRSVSPLVAGMVGAAALLPWFGLGIFGFASAGTASHWPTVLGWIDLLVALGIVSLAALSFSVQRQPLVLWAGLSFLLPALLETLGAFWLPARADGGTGLHAAAEGLRVLLLLQGYEFGSPQPRGRRTVALLSAGFIALWLLLLALGVRAAWAAAAPNWISLAGLALLGGIWLRRSRGHGATYAQLTLLVMLMPLASAQACGWLGGGVGGPAWLAARAESIFAALLLFLAFWQDALLTFRQKRRQEEQLRAEHAAQIELARQELEHARQAQQTQAELTRLLQFSLENVPFETVLEKILHHLAGIAWLRLEPRWVFLTPDPEDDLLRIAFSRGLETQESFACPGLTRYSSEGLGPAEYYYTRDFRHNPDPLVHPDGRCSVPLVSSEDRLLGLIVLQFAPGVVPESRTHLFLFSVAKVIVGILKRVQIEHELRTERDKVKSYLTLAGVAFLVLDPDLTVRWINHKACEILGLPEEAILGRTWTQSFVPEADRAKASTFYSRLMTSTGIEVDYGEHAVLTARGEERLLAWHSKVFRAEDGSVQTILSSGEDVTEREKADNALWESLVRYGRFFEDSPVAIWENDFNQVRGYLARLAEEGVADLAGHFERHPESLRNCLDLLQVVDVNQASVALFAARDKEDLKTRWRELILPESLAFFSAQMAALAGESTFFEGESLLKTLNGGRIQVVQRVSVLAEERGTWSKALVTFVDITERKRMETRLQESSARYSQFFEASPVSLWEAEATELQAHLASLPQPEDRDLRPYFAAHPDALAECLTLIRMRDCNQTSLRLFQAENKTILLARWHELLLEESLPVFLEMMLAMGRGQEEFERQIVFVSLTGRRIHAMVRTTLISRGDPARRVYLLSINDITERILMEGALRQSEEKHRVVIDNIGIGVAMISTRMEILTMNAQMRAWYPQVDPNLKPICYGAFNLPPAEALCTGCPVIETFADGRVHETVVDKPSPQGLMHFRVVSSPLKDRSGAIIAAIVMMEDITGKIRSEEALRKAHARTERLFSAIPSILISVDEDRRVTHWNPAAAAVFGIPADRTIGKPFAESGIRWDWAQLLGQLDSLSEAAAAPPMRELRFEKPDGKDGFLDVTLTPIKNSGGTGSELLLLAADVTEYRVLQNQLLQAQKLESIGQLAAGIAHEINTPTQYVGDNIRFLQEATTDLARMLESYGRLQASIQAGAADPAIVAEVQTREHEIDLPYLQTEVPKAIAESLEGVERVTTIVRAMKEFAHPDTGEKVPLDINQAIASTITVARNEWKYVANCVADFDPDLPLIPCLAGEFNQVILNLIVNAAHAIGDRVEGTTDKGQITITTRRERGRVLISIADTGTGIPEHVLPKIFDPFFTTKKVGKGSGQGLAISRNVIVEKHHGTLEVQTRINEGTTFMIGLPLT